jgi:hypothetical protein
MTKVPEIIFLTIFKEKFSFNLLSLQKQDF